MGASSSSSRRSHNNNNNNNQGRHNPNPNPPYYVTQGGGGGPLRPPGAAPPPLKQPPPYFDHRSTKKIKNSVNVHTDSVRVEVDEYDSDCYLVTFVFDATADGCFTIIYFAAEGDNCDFTPLYPEIHVPMRIPFEKGLGQKFHQPSGTGINLGYFDTDDLSKLIPGQFYPLIISAQSCLQSVPMEEKVKELPTTESPHTQITQAVLEREGEDRFRARVIKQILWADGVCYELREIYGVSSPDETTRNSNDSGKECIICMTEQKDTAVLPCRHMCLCSGCANALMLKSDKCPICRQSIEELIEIKVAEAIS